MVAESLLRDHDLRLEQDYAERRYAAFTDEDLAPHYRVRGRDGAIYSVHAIGLSLLVLPAYALAGYAGASFFMAALALLLVREVHGLLRAAGAGERLALALAALLALSPPLVQYVGLVFTEIPAALVLARALRGLVAPAPWRARDVVVWALPLCALPWFNVRYAPVTAIVLAGAIAARPTGRVAVAVAAAAATSAVGIALYHHALYGFFDPRLVWGARPEFSARDARRGAARPRARPGVRSAALRAGVRLLRAGPGAARARADTARGRGARARAGRPGNGGLLAHVARRIQPAGPLPGAAPARLRAGARARVPGRPRRRGRTRRRMGSLGRRVRSVGSLARAPRPRRDRTVLPRLFGRGRVDAPPARFRPRGVGGRPLAADGRLDRRARGRGPRAAVAARRRRAGSRSLRRRSSSPPERPRRWRAAAPEAAMPCA